MKLLRFSAGGARPHLGALVGESGIVDLTLRLPGNPTDMAALIDDWAVQRTLACSHVSDGAADVLLDEVSLCAPIGRTGKVLGIGLNYADHVAEARIAAPTDQVWFSKPSTAINGPFDGIQLPAVSCALDYEAELVIVIGRRCRHVSAARAREVIFGWSVGNDVSVRDWQLRTSQVFLGKSFDTHAPIGPWIVTADEVEDPHDLGIRSFVNGEKRQDSNTRNLIYNCFEQIAHVSKVMTLEPGDVIFSGTPGGVGFGFQPPRYLDVGDLVRIEIDNIGALESRVVPEPLNREYAPS